MELILLLPTCMANDGGMGPVGGETPRKRRRSGGTSAPAGEVLRQVHMLFERREVSIKGFVLATDDELRTRGRASKSGGRKEVGGFILVDDSCLVELSVCQVSRFKSPCAKKLYLVDT